MIKRFLLLLLLLPGILQAGATQNKVGASPGMCQCTRGDTAETITEDWTWNPGEIIVGDITGKYSKMHSDMFELADIKAGYTADYDMSVINWRCSSAGTYSYSFGPVGAYTWNRTVNLPDADGTVMVYTAPPAHSNTTCKAGQFALDSTYFYWCWKADTWLRVEYTEASW